MNTDMQFLTKDDIRKQAPLVLAEEPTRKVSDSYTFVSTEQVIDDLEKFGWKVTGVGQRTPKKMVTNQYGTFPKKSKFSPHMVKLANPDFKITDGEEGGQADVQYPQIILNNNHDGRGAFKFQAGIYRLVCSNGLVIATAQFNSLKIRHRGYSFDEIKELVEKRVKSIPEQIEVMNEMKNRDLSRSEQEALALEALSIRSNVPAEKKEEFQGTIDKVTLNEVLHPERKMDQGNDLWVNYQKLQEKIIKGGFHMQMGLEANVRKVKPIRSFLTDQKINKQLFESARAML